MVATLGRTWAFAWRDMLSKLSVCLSTSVKTVTALPIGVTVMKNRKSLLVILLTVGMAIAVGLSAFVDGAAAAADSTKTRLEEFRPTEKVPADHAISFPVDI